MGYVATIGLLFAPILCLLCSGWFFVRWQNENEDEAVALKNKKICLRFLVAAGVALVVFGGLKLLFPVV